MRWHNLEAPRISHSHGRRHAGWPKVCCERLCTRETRWDLLRDP
jgi:hypothetical protein